jgi:hypothetical protein
VLASVRSATLTGVDGHVVTVEVHVSTGLPSYHVVGLPDAAVRESRERVRAALLSSAIEFPLQRITVNLAPGGVRKTGARPHSVAAVKHGLRGRRVPTAESRAPGAACTHPTPRECRTNSAVGGFPRRMVRTRRCERGT